MEGSGFWGSKYFSLKWWADNYWNETEASTEGPRYTFLANKVFLFKAQKNYSFLSSKIVTFRSTPRTYIFKANKLYSFVAHT